MEFMFCGMSRTFSIRPNFGMMLIPLAGARGGSLALVKATLVGKEWSFGSGSLFEMSPKHD
jgi:hypothetical protein